MSIMAPSTVMSVRTVFPIILLFTQAILLSLAAALIGRHGGSQFRGKSRASEQRRATEAARHGNDNMQADQVPGPTYTDYFRASIFFIYSRHSRK